MTAHESSGGGCHENVQCLDTDVDKCGMAVCTRSSTHVHVCVRKVTSGPGLQSPH